MQPYMALCISPWGGDPMQPYMALPIPSYTQGHAYRTPHSPFAAFSISVPGHQRCALPCGWNWVFFFCVFSPPPFLPFLFYSHL